MLARIKIKEEQEEKRVRRINEINKLKEFNFSRSQKLAPGFPQSEGTGIGMGSSQ